MLTKTRRRVATLIAITTMALFAMPLPPAQADLINGVCTLDMTFTFTSGPTLTGDTSPGYSITIDEDESDCTLDTLDPTPSVSVTGSAGAGSGGTSLARCGVLAGLGPWNQFFGNAVASVVNGSHAVSGTWLHATMVVTGLPTASPTAFTGVIELTPHPDEPLANAYKVAACGSGGNVSSIRMLGVQVFNDPEL